MANHEHDILASQMSEKDRGPLLRYHNYQVKRSSFLCGSDVPWSSSAKRQMELQELDSRGKPFAIFEGQAEGKRPWPPDCLKDLEAELLSIGEIGNYN